jgi:hypothetical protein
MGVKIDFRKINFRISRRLVSNFGNRCSTNAAERFDPSGQPAAGGLCSSRNPANRSSTGTQYQVRVREPKLADNIELDSGASCFRLEQQICRTRSRLLACKLNLRQFNAARLLLLLAPRKTPDVACGRLNNHHSLILSIAWLSQL